MIKHLKDTRLSGDSFVSIMEELNNMQYCVNMLLSQGGKVKAIRTRAGAGRASDWHWVENWVEELDD